MPDLSRAASFATAVSVAGLRDHIAAASDS